MNINDAVVFDVECFPNVFTLTAYGLFNDFKGVWQISPFRDDRQNLIHFFNWLAQTQTPMVGFNNIHYDYPMIHYFYMNPTVTPAQLFEKNNAIINNFVDRFAHVIWERDRFAPQIDLFKIHHFDNPAKSTGLKALEINMRSPSVVDMPFEHGTVLTQAQIDGELIPYNGWDVGETKQFAHYSMDAINFRISLIPQFGIDVLNWSDTKIGTRMMELRIGQELCYIPASTEICPLDGYTRIYNKKRTRQTPRGRIALADVIFPYVRFEHPEFQRVHTYLYNQVLTSDDIKEIGSDAPAKVKTKGVFTGLQAHVNGLDFDFGTGGIHGSVSSQRIVATDEWLIRDIDVAALYPSIAIVNNLAPAHLGERFTQVYSQLPQERRKWQKEKGKKCIEANTLKLASNGVYGNSNNVHSAFYDPQYTMATTVNGQLLLCMLAEKLMTVPTLKIIQINTDGITYYIHRDNEPQAVKICHEWEALTRLTLEDANYSRMWIRDVNNYIAEGVDGSMKTKGAYWTPDPLDYVGSISSAQPPAWHKDLGNAVSVRAAVAAMVHGVDPAQFIRLTTNPYDFMCRIKVRRSDMLLWGDDKMQRNTRYYVSTDGKPLSKTAPPTGPAGVPKKASGVSDAEYQRVMAETGWKWDARVCTKNKSVHQDRRTAIQSGYNVTICNKMTSFNFGTVNYDWYINEAKKLVI